MPFYGGPLHYACYPRKPRGGPPDLPEVYTVRFSLCCGRLGCRRRVLPASVLFWGRRVYWAALLLVVPVLRQGRSFKASHVHALWHLDFHLAQIRLLGESGQWLRPVALAILDDDSRLCCHLQFYLAETAECLVHGLSQAIMKRGLPRALMSNNGSAMLAEETRNGLARLAILHETTLPYSPYQNGKQEVLGSQLEGRLLELLRRVENRSFWCL